MTVKFKVMQVGGASVDHTLTFDKPGRLRWETPVQLVIADGKTLTTYDKARNLYSQSPITEGWTKQVFADPAVWVWSAFFDTNFLKPIISTKKVGGRSVKGVALTDFHIEREGLSIGVSTDDAAGIVRNYTYRIAGQGDFIVQASDVLFSKKPKDDALFAFTPPEGAMKKSDAEASMKALTYADVKPLFDQYCTTCHGGPNPARGIDLSSHSAITSGRSITVGSGAQSRIVRIMRSGQMPPQSSPRIPQEGIDKISAWIDGGAKP